MTIPKKPLAVSRAKKKLPVELDWGPGIKKDRLAYINADEKALIQRFRKTKAARDYAGIPAFADDSSSSKGVERSDSSSSRGADGPSGVGRGSGGGGSTSTTKSGSTSTSSTASGGSSNASSTSKTASAAPSSASTLSAATSRPSSAPNAAAQAASNKLNGTSSAPVSRTNAFASSGSMSRAPNAAAAAASQKLNATANALKTGQQPQSIQGMINSGATAPNAAARAAFDRQKMAAMSRRYDPVTPGAPIPSAGLQPGAMPGQFVRSALAYNVNNAMKRGVTDAATIVNGYNNLKQFKDVGYNPDGVQKIKDRLGYTPVGIRTNNPGNILDSGWQKNMPGYTGPVTSPNGLTYSSYSDPRWGLTAQNELLGRYYDGGRNTINSVVDRYAPVDENNSAAANKAYKEHLAAQTGWGRDQELTREQVQSLGPYKTSFENGGTVFAGGPFGGTPGTSATTALAAAAPRPQSIPSPISMGMLPEAQRAQTKVVTDPRVGMNMSAASAPAEPETPPGYFSQFAMTENDIANLKTQAMKDFGFSDLMQMQKNISALPGFMGPIARDQQRVASLAAQPAAPAAPAPSVGTRVVTDPRVAIGLPSNGPTRLAAGNPATYSPQSAPEDDPVYSENPMQGSQNPMQEGPAVEDPGVRQARQKSYAARGATAGSIIAGPLGAVIGGTLGWQMGKTTPGQRQAIASNPQSLSANVQSINTMVEERGGKGNPQMRVTDSGLRDVLTNPQKVTENPAQYTTLEQMLAALALGIDPETGKPIT